MIITLYDSRDDPTADEAFGRWYQQQTGEAFFLNQHGAHQATLHRAPCGHYVFHEPVRLAQRRKVCAERVADLRQWAQEAGIAIRDCTDCNPRPI
ncbi:MAG: hypothetical protein AB1941_14870 [Gemmatimonadota bacterium]